MVPVLEKPAAVLPVRLSENFENHCPTCIRPISISEAILAYCVYVSRVPFITALTALLTRAKQSNIHERCSEVP
jgi:hypothetical protein